VSIPLLVKPVIGVTGLPSSCELPVTRTSEERCQNGIGFFSFENRTDPCLGKIDKKRGTLPGDRQILSIFLKYEIPRMAFAR